jgi:hypothetical protein
MPLFRHPDDQQQEHLGELGAYVTISAQVRCGGTPGGGSLLFKNSEDKAMPASMRVPGCMGLLGEGGLPCCFRPPIHQDFFMSCFWFGSTVAKSARSVGVPEAT